jgi:hypothetical protein
MLSSSSFFIFLLLRRGRKAQHTACRRETKCRGRRASAISLLGLVKNERREHL